MSMAAATVARMRGRPGSSGFLIAEAGLRLAAASLLGSLAVALSLIADGQGRGGLAETWLWVQVRAGLGPDLHPAAGPTGLDGAPLGLTLLVLAVAFRLGQRLGPAGYALLAAVPVALAAAVLALLAGEPLGVAAAVVSAVPAALGLAAGSEWWRRQGGGRSNTLLRAAMTAATGVIAGLLLAGLIAAVVRDFGPGGFVKLPTEAVVLAGFWPAAAFRAIPGIPAAGLLAGLFAPALFLAPRARRERLLCAGLAGGALTVVALAAGGGWRTALPSALVGSICAVLAAGLAPVLGATAPGHLLAGLPLLRGFGDRLPPPAAVELTAERMRPRGTAAPPARRLTTAGLAVSLIAAGTAILCVVAVLAVTLTGEAPRALPPEQQAAQAYLSALGSNDAGRIWATVELSDVQLPPGDHLLGRNDLGRMLTVAANRHQRIASVTLVESSHTPASVVYQATYREGGDFSSAQLTLQKVGPRWKVVLSPAAIAIPALPAGVSVAVDGTPLKVAAGQAATVSVLPGVHAVRESTAAPYADRSLQVTADQPLPAIARPDLAPALDPAAAAAARNFAAGIVLGCISSNSARPAGCPNQVDVPPGTPVTWTSVGPAAADAALQLNPAGGLLIRAHYQLVAAYPVHVPEDTKHVAVGSGLSAPVAWTGGGWQSAGAPLALAFDAPRPGAADSALVDAVRAGFNACAASHLLRPADCPQTLPSSGYVANVQWHLTADPVAATTISFDTQRSLFSVTGGYAMSVTYTEAGSARANNVGGGYRADIFWDGSRPVLVNIART